MFKLWLGKKRGGGEAGREKSLQIVIFGDKSLQAQIDIMVESTRIQAEERMRRSIKYLQAKLSRLDGVEVACQMYLTYFAHSPNDVDRERQAEAWRNVELICWITLNNRAQIVEGRAINGPDMASIYFAASTYFASAIRKEVFDSKTNPLDLLSVKADTILIRGEEHLSTTIRLVQELYSSFDDYISDRFGFTTRDSVLLFEGINSVLQGHFDSRMKSRDSIEEKLRDAVNALRRKPKHLCTSKDENFLEIIRKQGENEFVKAQTVAALLSNTTEVLSVTAEELSLHLNGAVCNDSILCFLDFLSIRFGEEVDPPSIETLNPLRVTPIIKRENQYIIPLLQIVSEAFISRLHFELIGDKSFQNTYDKVRSAWMENKVLEGISSLLPSAKVLANCKYGPKKARLEIDAIGWYDGKLLLIEAKWKKLQLSSRHGNTNSLIEDLSKSILHASEQANRAEAYVLNNKSVVFTSKQGEELVIRRDDITSIEHICVLSNDPQLCHLASKFKKLCEIFHFDSSRIPWAISITDLMVLGKYLESPSYLFDYLRRRSQVLETDAFALYDEWDLIGCYLKNHLDVRNYELDKFDFVLLSGMDDDLNQFEMHQGSPYEDQEKKPRKQVPLMVDRMIRIVDTMNYSGRTDANLLLLGLPASELEKMSDHINKVCARTARTRIPSYCVLQCEGLNFTFLYGNVIGQEVSQKSMLEHLIPEKLKEYGRPVYGIAVNLDQLPDWFSFGFALPGDL